MFSQKTSGMLNNAPYSADLSQPERDTMFCAIGDGDQFSDIQVTFYDRPEDIMHGWRLIEKHASSPFSCTAWSNAWYEALEDNPHSSPAILYGQNNNEEPEFLLPLISKKVGPCRVLMRPGFKHSAYFEGIFAPSLRQRINSENAEKFWSLVFASVPGFDALLLDGVSHNSLRQNHPLVYLPRLRSGNPSYRLELPEDWETLYLSMTNSKTRSNDRRCEKRLVEAGKLQYRVAKDPAEKRQFLDNLLAQKAQCFNTMEIVDPFAAPEVHSFYNRLVSIEDQTELQSLFVSSIFLDNEALATNLGVLHNNELHGLIMSTTLGDFRRFAPGRLLLLKTNQYLSEKGITAHDFGVGESSYKNDWCEQTVYRDHVLTPLGIKGWMLVRAIRLAAFSKNWIKQSDFLTKYTLKLMCYYDRARRKEQPADKVV